MWINLELSLPRKESIGSPARSRIQRLPDRFVQSQAINRISIRSGPPAFMMESPEAFTVTSSAEDLRHAARIGDADEASRILQRYEGEENKIAKFLPAVVAAADGLSGNRALHLCAANGHLDVLEMLLSYGADIDATNQAGSTALHYASLNGRLEIVKKLIERGAQPVVENKYGKTALDEARAARKTESAEFLIAHVENTGTAVDLEKEEAGDKNRG